MIHIVVIIHIQCPDVVFLSGTYFDNDQCPDFVFLSGTYFDKLANYVLTD